MVRLVIACALAVASTSAVQLPGIGDESAWRERKFRELKSDEVRERRGAAQAMCRKDIDGSKLIDALLPALSDTDREVRRNVLIALRIHGVGRGDVAAVLRDTLDDEDAHFVAETIYALSVVDPNPEESIEALVRAALRDDRTVTPAAVGFLEKIGAPAVPALAALLTDRGWVVRRQAIGALKNLGEIARGAVPAMVHAATIPSNINVV